MKSGDRRSQKTSNAPPDDVLLKDYQTMSGREMAEKYNVSEGCIRKWIQNARLTSPDGERLFRKHNKDYEHPPDDVLLKDYKTLTAKDMAEKYGVTEASMKNWIRNALLRNVSAEERRTYKSKKPSDDVLLEEYTTLTAREIAEKYGVTEGAVRVWLRDARNRLNEM